MGVPNPSKHKRTGSLVPLGAAIRRLRLAKGLSQEQLALRADVDPGYVGRIERGDNNAAILTIQKLTRALGISIAKLMQEAKL